MSLGSGKDGKGGGLEVVVVGGGQAGLAVGYYLRRSGLTFAIFEAAEGPGGAWRRMWDSLHAFSPPRYSSLPGWLMPGGAEGYPARDEVVEYLALYEERYELPVHRPVRVENVWREDDRLVVKAGPVRVPARAVVSATGTWTQPYIPDYPGRESFRGEQLHTLDYENPEPYRGQRVLVVGGGNSGAQILAEISKVAQTTWVTLEKPQFMPDDVDGRVLFDRATKLYQARREGREEEVGEINLAKIVMVPPVREARERGVLKSVRPFERFTEDGVMWPDGTETLVDAVIWCTGFRPSLEHLDSLGVTGPDGRVETEGTRSVREPRLWLVGYGDWTGFASATMLGVGRTARFAVQQIEEMVNA